MYVSIPICSAFAAAGPRERVSLRVRMGPENCKMRVPATIGSLANSPRPVDDAATCVSGRALTISFAISGEQLGFLEHEVMSVVGSDDQQRFIPVAVLLNPV